jgi:hypothetical protein
MTAARAGMKDLSEVGLWTVSDPDLLRLAVEAETVRRQAEAVQLRLVAELHARNLPVQAGARSTVGWLVAKTHVGRGEARRLVVTADRLSRHAPAVHAALAAGSIGVAHAGVIAQVMGVVFERSLRWGSPITADVRTAAEATLVELAATLDPAQLAQAGAVLVETIDPDGDVPYGGATDPALAEEAERRVTLTSTGVPGWKRLGGTLDPEAAAVVEAALSPLMAPRPSTAEGPDTRSTARRRGDALVDLAQLALTSGALPSEGGGSGATVFVHCDQDHLEGQVSDTDPTLDTGVRLPVESLRRLACDAMILPAVLASTSQPLDIGRASRLVPLGMRRALIARDKHCAFPGCDVPAAWCHAHHIQYWANGGPTAIHNLVLLCGHHHRLIHHSAWDVHLEPDGLPAFTPPPWVTPDIATTNPTWRITIHNRHPKQPRAA